MTQGAGQGPEAQHGGLRTASGSGSGHPQALPVLGAAVHPGPAVRQPIPAPERTQQPLPARQDATEAHSPHSTALAHQQPAGAPHTAAEWPPVSAPQPHLPDPRPSGAPRSREAAPAPATRSAPLPTPAPAGSAQPDAPEPAASEQPPHSAEYTPTRQDIPVVGEVTEGEPTLVDTPAPVVDPEESDGPLFVVGDVHGYLDELRAALRQAGLTDADDHWAAGRSRLWFLGDFTDRGPDGVGVIDLVMQLSAEAAAAGGYCKALLGNHELLLLGAKRFGDTPVNSGAGTASFQAAWLLNGGQRSDMERLEDHHLQWMSRLDAMTLTDGHLLVHSDATCYREYGDTIEAVNDAVTEAVQRHDADETWDLFRKFTKRFAFRDEGSGGDTARELLAAYGGERIVHGHSPIPYLLGQAGGEDENGAQTPPDITGPMVYADGLAIAMDGGVTMAGKLLVTQLPLDE